MRQHYPTWRNWNSDLPIPNFEERLQRAWEMASRVGRERTFSASAPAGPGSSAPGSSAPTNSGPRSSDAVPVSPAKTQKRRGRPLESTPDHKRTRLHGFVSSSYKRQHPDKFPEGEDEPLEEEQEQPEELQQAEDHGDDETAQGNENETDNPEEEDFDAGL